jgi:GT2 family glycosyltransferase/glycosyltransferase involved in cell wall biosynthesis
LLHYLRIGADKGLNPHWLFDTRYYQSRYTDFKGSGFLHFLKHGQFERRQTSRFFDPEFYLGTQVDTWRSGALVHYLKRGRDEGRSPAVDFDAEFYKRLHPDVAQTGADAFEHYVRFGHAEGRRTRGPRMESAADKSYLPVGSQNYLQAAKLRVSIVIPVYRGRDETVACLESVLATVDASVSIVVINDASPEPDLAAYLQSLAERKLIHLIEHKSNAGFVASVNEGMRLHPEKDVVLLNSDTQVFGNWLTRLSGHAYSGRVASVTPFSNNATICSYPKFCENNVLPPDVSAAELDRAICMANAGRQVKIPTAVGFCMYIRRDALNEIGLFDEEAFGRGYGEENDFCMRAMYAGWVHLLAADTFVYHAGAISFGASNRAEQQAQKALAQKHPRYADHVAWHCSLNPASAYRIAATLHRLAHEGRSVRLNIVHSFGGGTVEHARRVERMTHERLSWVNMAPAEDKRLRFYCERQGYEFSLIIEPLYERALLLRMLRYLKLERVHIHHLKGFAIDVRVFVEEVGVPYDVTLHDYFFVCPRVNFNDESGRYCGEGDCGCEDRFANPHGRYCRIDGELVTLEAWRRAHGALLAGADRVIAPSADTAGRFQRYFPLLNVTAAWHENFSAPVLPRPLREDEPLKVAVLGIMALHKGFYNFRDCVQLAVERGAPVQFVLIGPMDDETSAMEHRIVSTGRSDPDELPQLLKQQAPHLVWFPCQWPETFSYTLSTCLEYGSPVAVPDLGAFAERLDRREWSWIMPWDTTASDWMEFFVRIREENFLRGMSPQLPRTAREVVVDFYPGRI